MEKIHGRRIKKIFMILVIIMTALIFRLAYIQLICHEDLEEAAISQYEIVIDGLDTRGMILDRNSVALTGCIEEYYYIVSKENEDDVLEEFMSEINAKQIAKETSSYHVYKTQIFNDDINDKLKSNYGAYVFRNFSRYSEEQLACHVIGYINQDEKKGVSGLELLCQDELAASEEKLTIWADAAGNILVGTEPKICEVSDEDDFTSNHSIVTTIDRRTQYICEKALSEAGESGAAIVMDADTGEILACSSAPTFDPNNIEEYVTADSDCLMNKAWQGAYAPGSVFKIVTAAAALESGVCDVDYEIECKGNTTVNGVTLGCATAPEGGHGFLNMTDAMACSCNCYFAELGNIIGSRSIVEMASKLGLGETTAVELPEESNGNIPLEENIFASDISNISIGQGEILATPLQIAVMTSVIANGGKLVSPSILLGESESYYCEEVLSSETVEKISKMLKAVMDEGTGKGEYSVDVYGKTGTAETGDDDKNCWFTGYCTVGSKTYVVTVMVENGISGSSTALPVFKEIVEFLVRAGNDK